MPRRRPHPTRLLACLLALAFAGTSRDGAAQGPTPAVAPAPVSEAEAPAPPADVLILHHSPPGLTPPGIVDGRNLLDLLGHFGLKGKLLSMSDYEKGEIARHSFVIVLGDDDRNEAFPQDVILDVRQTAVPVLWIRRHIHELLADKAFANKLGFGLGPELLRGFDHVEYKGHTLTKNEPFLFPVLIKSPAKVQIVATATNAAGESHPYVVHAGNFWYFADSPFAFATEGDRYWVLCDLLHDFFGIPHEERREALLRIEDVSVELDPKVLTDLADFLHDRDVPFQVSLIPIYKRPEDGRETLLADKPLFVKALKYMVSKGGTIIMHGATHQYRGKSGDDYEFWDGLNGRPIRSDSRTLVEQKLHLGLEELLRNGLYPVAWETPHYMASQLDYEVIGQHFSCAYESVPSLDREDSAHGFPYPSFDRFGRYIIPESLGYIDLEKPEVERMLENAGRLEVVRDGIASFFFHPFLDRDMLARLIDGIEGMGYEFTSVRDFNCRIKFDDMVVQTHDMPVQLTLEDRYLHRFLVDATGDITDETYSPQPVSGVVQDGGVVPQGTMLVMEGVFTVRTQKAAEAPSLVQRAWDAVRQRFARAKEEELPVLEQPRAVVLWDDTLPRSEWNNESSYVSALSAFGFVVKKEDAKDFSPGSIETGSVLVAPAAVAAKLTDKQVSGIDAFVHGGGRLVTEGQSKLAAALGIKPQGSRPHLVRNLGEMLYGSETMVWNPPAEILRFSMPEPLTTYVIDQVSELPVALLFGIGDGRLLYLAAPLDPTSTLGYTRYPYFVHYVLQGFGLKLPLKRGQLEVYFDPGLRQGIDSDRLAIEWRKMGVRAIYAAAWQFYERWSFDYAHLIDVCHKNGILVYAWLELPHVSQKFWEEHPNWRAKTATGQDGVIGWRSHMDLDIPEAQDAAFAFVEDLLRAQAWDGVNIAELNYDTDSGPETPKKYLPMGDSTRQAFRALGGFDPIELFSPPSPYYWKANPSALRKFEDYRSQRVESWHRALLRRLVPLAKERDLEIIVTMLDSLHSPTLRRDTGVNSHAIVGLMNEFPFTLQVEDPEHFWAESPARYTQFTETYLRLVKDRRRLMFDLNVVPNRDISRSHSPTALMSGTELVQSMLMAGEASGRVGIYSEGTVPFEDLQALARVLARDAKIKPSGNGWLVDAAKPVLLTAPGLWQAFRVDGKVWPGWGERDVIIPSGQHEIAAAVHRKRLVDTSALDFRLVHFNGGLLDLVPNDRGLQLSYDSSTRAMALFSRQPFEVRVDGEVLSEEPQYLTGHWSVRLPRGKHVVDVVADNAATIILDTASLYSSSVIVIFGGLACALMVLLYMAIIVRRALGHGVDKKSPPAPLSRS